VGSNGTTALTLLCAHGFRTGESAAASRDMALQLLAQGASATAVNSDGGTALTMLCSNGFSTAESATCSREVALQLLAQGADAKAVTSNGNTALALLCCNGFSTAESAAVSRDVALQLLAQGADAKAVSSDGNTALKLLCCNGFSTAESATASREVALQLLAQGADTKAVSSDGNTALTLLFWRGFSTAESATSSREVALRLLAQGADAKAVTSHGNTALMLLCETGFSTAESATTSCEVALQLLSYGADAKAVDSDGDTALGLLCEAGFKTAESATTSREVALQLLAQGADAKAVNNDGATVLINIAKFGQGPAATDIAKHLILKGATLTHKKDGKTAEEHACEQGNFEMAILIANQSRATALYAYTAQASDQLSVTSGEILTVLEKFDTGWWCCRQGTVMGLVPGSYLQMAKSMSSADSPAPLAPSDQSSAAAESKPALPRDNSDLNALGQMTASLTIKHPELSFAQKLGEGGFGEVVQGTWRHMDVAIKRLHMKQMSAEALSDFKIEAAILADLRSPHTVALLGITLTPEYTMVMEYMPRGALYDVLHSNEPLPWPTRQQIALDMSLGLSFLHHERMLHRDLKSLNVLLDNHYHAKLAGFGLSKIKRESSTRSAKGHSLGTVAWKAPELFKRGCKYTPECDMYSFGMTLWELETRKLPFADANDNGEISVWVLQGEQETIPTDTPEGIRTVIQACWSKQSAQRPSADNVVELLKASAPTTAPQHSPALEDTAHIPEAGSTGQAALPEQPLPQAGDDQGTRGGYQVNSSGGAAGGTQGSSQPSFFSPRSRAGHQMNSGAPTTLTDQKNAGASHARGATGKHIVDHPERGGIANSLLK
jgi:serine/threonine protein kinase/ankyrin repeat protein